MKTRELIQMGAWLQLFGLALLMGIPERIYSSFFPVFNEMDFVSLFFSLYVTAMIAISFPLFYKYFD